MIRWGDALAALFDYHDPHETARRAICEALRDAVMTGPTEETQAIVYAGLCQLYPKDMKAAAEREDQ